jgi:hypothetical protein
MAKTPSNSERPRRPSKARASSLINVAQASGVATDGQASVLEPAAAPRSSILPDLEPNSIVTRTGAFIEPHLRAAMIAEAAYYLAERRAFDPGHDMDDWFTAEQQIDAALAGGLIPGVDATPAADEAIRRRSN